MSFHFVVRALRVVRGRSASACLFLLCLPWAATPAFADEALSFKEALSLAEIQAPQLLARAASVRAAADEAVRAPQLPDPELVAGIDNLPVDSADRFSFTRDFMTMRKIGVMQAFPRKEKRRLRGERAEADVRKEEAELVEQRLDVRREVALAWIERYLAERVRDLVLELRAQAELSVQTGRAALSGSKSNAASVLAATADRIQLDDRLDTSSRDIEQAKATLARWIGREAADRPLGEAPDFRVLGASPESLEAHVGEHAALQPYVALEARAQAEVALARAEKSPDWSVEVAYAQRGPAYSNMLSVEFKVDLPIFASHRQDPAIAAKLAELDRVRAEREDAVRMHREAIQKALVSWTTARKRLARTTDELLPLTEARADAALAAYRGGGDLQAVIAARTAQIDARMASVNQMGDLARAWVALRFLVQDKE